MSSSFIVNKADLTFILKQIKIAEVHASGTRTLIEAIQDVYGVSAADAALLPAGLRTVDGRFNNLLPGQNDFGAADVLMPRLTTPVFINEADGDQMPLGPGAPIITNTDYAAPGSVADADPRIISNLISDLTAANPAAVYAALASVGITGVEATTAATAIRAAYLGNGSGPGPAALAAIAAQAAEDAAQAVLATETAQQAAAAAANALALAKLAAYNSALAQDVEVKVSAAQDAVALMVVSLGAAGSALNAADLAAHSAALNTATVASNAASAAVTALLANPNVAPADLAGAQAVANATATLVTQLTALGSALSSGGSTLDSTEFNAAAAVDNLATGNASSALAGTNLLLAGQTTAGNAAASTTSALAIANATVAQDIVDRDAAIAASNAADAAAIAAQTAETVATNDLAASNLARSNALTALATAQSTLTGYTNALAQDVEIKVLAAQTATSALLTSLGGVGVVVDAADVSAASAAVLAASQASSAAAAAVSQLSAVANVSAAALSGAQAVASQAASLHSSLSALIFKPEKTVTSIQFTAVQNALTSATNNTAAANANSALIVTLETSAAAVVVAANAAVVTANANVAQDTLDLNAATAASDAADANALAMQTAENSAIADLAASTALRDSAAANNDSAQATLVAYNSALAQDVEVRAASAQIAVAALEVSLGAVGSPIDAADLNATSGALATATLASNAAAAAVSALQSGPGIPSAHLASAQAVAANAATLVSQLLALQSLINSPASNLSLAAFNAGAAANTLASSNEVAALSNFSQLTSSQTSASNAAGTANAALLQANAELAAANTSYLDAVAASDAADAAALIESQNGGGGASLNSVLDSYGIGHDPSGSMVVPNLSPDIGLSPGFNSWMTYFGQFFDHGLDLVTKGGGGTVYIPLQPDDPLYVAGSPTNFMALTRATPTIVDGVPQHENTTTSWIDQNQTYTSHASHQAFLREYKKLDIDGSGGNGPVAVSTGHLLDGTAASGSISGAIANWGEVKTQAKEMLGIILSDFDVHNVPLLATDVYGKFIPGAHGFAQLVMPPDATHATNWLLEGTAAGLAVPATALRSNHAFLNDIAHHAAPSMVDLDHDPSTPKTAQVADADIDANHNGIYDAGDTLTDVNKDGVINTADFYAADRNANGSLNEATYDDEMLNSHFITGDGRGNENIALTSVHSIFHSEHNRMVEANKATILESNDLAFLNEWLLADVQEIPTSSSDIAALVWDGERLFQAARFTTEMQYQHLVFEEFARRIQPNIDPFVFNNSPNIDPTIVAEFAHTVYRFGHSMLTGTVDRLENDLTTVNGATSQETLLAAFLNPQMYVGSGSSVEQVNGDLVRGLTRDVGGEIDEFVIQDVRSNLLGLPLDLAALNIARGRDTGIPSLNETRQQLYDGGALDLKPYVSWNDFAQHIKNPLSLVNFIAAYGTHASITSATTTAQMRDAATLLLFGDGSNADGVTIRGVTYSNAERLAFLNGSDAYTGGAVTGAVGSLGGLNKVDLWIGGLAESKNEFGGMLGQTFNYIFERQMEELQFADRLYYLTRTQGTNLLNQLEPNTFSDLVMRNTDLGGMYSTHLNGALFVTPDYIIELDRGIAQTDYNGSEAGKDPLWSGADPLNEAILGDKVVRSYVGSTVVDGGHDVGGYIRFQGGEHVVLGGTEGNDTLLSDKGIDTIWGDGGNDYINAGMESDNVFGGDGDDIIEDPFGDDVLRGNLGNDVITEARGIDLIFGDQGADYIVIGQDGSEAFGGADGDFILGGAGGDFLLGNEGNDWIEGGSGFDTIAGDNSDLFFNSPIIGHDVMFNQGDEGDYDAESGDDIMGSGPSVFRYEGMAGFDWGIGKYDISGVAFDLAIPIFTTVPANVLRDRFDMVESLSGWKYDDQLDGDNRGHDPLGVSVPGQTASALFVGHELTQEGINRIAGLNTWLQGARNTLFGSVAGADATSFRDGNLLLGGDGNDFLRGRGGYDILDGDAWLNVRIAIDLGNGQRYSAESMTTDTTVMGPFAGKVFNVNADGSPNFASPAFGGRTLTSLLLDRTINPGQLSIVREILDGTIANGETDTDTAIFQGSYAEYSIEGRGLNIDLNNDGDTNDAGEQNLRAYDVNGDGFISVRDMDNGLVGATVNGVVLASRGVFTDDLDLLKNVEHLQFADQTIAIAGNNAVATGTVSINDLTTFNGRVTPYVGQVLTASLTGVADADGLSLTGGLPTGLTFDWQLSLRGNNSAWTTIQTGTTYTVRDLDVGQVLRAVAVFKDNAGVTERVSSSTTVAATLAPTVAENSPTGTVVMGAISFNQAVDTLVPGGALTPATITHVIRGTNVPATDVGGGLAADGLPAGSAADFSAGGRFKVVDSGNVDPLSGATIFSVVVANGGPAMLDYEAVQGPYENQYQIVIDTYDTAALGTLVASRQFTILLSDVVVETPPVTDIQWNGILPISDTALPGAGAVIANLATDVPNTGFTLVAGSSPDFAISTLGEVTRIGTAMATNQTYTLQVQSGTYVETFSVRTGTTAANVLNGTTGDNALYGLGGGDTLNGLAGNDTLYGQAGTDTLNGGSGIDFLHGGGGGDILIGGDGADTIDTGAANDNIRDAIRYSAVSEYGDVAYNFDANGTVDRVEFTGALNTALDDGNNDDNILFATGTAGVVNALVGQNNADIEGLFLTGATAAEGVLGVNLSNAALVSDAFNARFNITAANGEDALLVINDTDGNNFAVYHWIQAGGGEIAANELTLVGVYNGNATVTTTSFDFV